MRRLIFIIGMMLLVTPLSFAQNGHDLFQKALQKERAEGNLEAAITLYERIVEEHASDRALVAKALVQMGQNYERLGRTVEAQRVFATVVREYADQAEAAQLARAKITVTQREVKEEESGIVVRRVWTAPEGQFILFARDLSPDGRFIAFTNWDEGSLVVRDLINESKKQLTETAWPNFPYVPVFSPDGKTVVYSWVNNQTGSFELRTVGVEGSEPKVLYHNEAFSQVYASDWSPDGKDLVGLFYARDQTTRIVRLSGADGSMDVLKSLDWRAPERLSFSPDGRYIVYDFPPEELKPERDLYVLALDGSSEVRLTEHPANDRWPTWSPDGRHILFFSNRDDKYAVWAVPVEDGKAQGAAYRVKQGMDDTAPLGFVGEDAFYYTLYTGVDDRYLTKIDWQTGEPAATPKVIDFPDDRSTFSPDGRFVAYVPESHHDGERARIIIRSIETERERILLPDLNWLKRRIYWSPDGQTFLVNGRDRKNRSGIFTIDAEAGDATPVLYDQPDEYWLDNQIWSKDGATIYFGRNYTKMDTTEIVARDLKTGRERVLYDSKNNTLFPDFQLSPDGEWLAFRTVDSTTQKWPLMLVPTGGGEARELLNIENYRIHTWTPDGKGIIYLQFLEGGAPNTPGWNHPRALRQVSVEDGTVRTIETGLDLVVSFRLHPDGEHVIIGVYEDGAEVWMMEGFLPEDDGAK